MQYRKIEPSRNERVGHHFAWGDSHLSPENTETSATLVFVMPGRPQPSNTRSRSGCLNCRRRKRKCDERRPTCQGCVRRKETCEWGMRVTFRNRNALSLAGESRKRESGARHGVRLGTATDTYSSSPDIEMRQRPGTFLPATVNHDHRECASETHSFLFEDPDADDDSHTLFESSTTAAAIASPSVSLPSVSHDSFSYSSNTPSLNTLNTDDSVIATLVSLREDVYGHGHDRVVRQERAPLTESRDSGEVGNSTPLLSTTFALDNSFFANSSFPNDCLPSAPSPLEDTIFWPGSAYHELHSTLRSHIIYEVQSNAPTRPCTPTTKCDGNGRSTSNSSSDSNGAAGAILNGEEAVCNNEKHRIVTTSTSAHRIGWDAYTTAPPPLEWPAHLLPDDHEAPVLPQDEEIALWTNWFQEIAPWLDKFDTHRHFQHVLPQMAQKSESLRYAMLALSARQIERKEQEKEDDEAPKTTSTAPDMPAGKRPRGSRSDRTEHTGRSLALYQQAIHLLLPQLHTRTTAVIAACVVLCVLEMMSCSPKAWRRHLDGCAGLMQAVGYHGLVGGVEQALFWCFARMDVCGGLISSVRTLIPAGLWLGTSLENATRSGSLDEFEAGESRFQTTDARGFDMAANHAVYLMAQVLDLLYGLPVAGAENTRPAPPPICSDAYRARWVCLWRRLENWRAQRPPELHEILSIPSPVPSGTQEASPFPALLYSNPAAISGNQMYHTAAVLLLQNLPASVRFSHLSSLSPNPSRVPPRSILWHARQICGISLTNHHHGAWTNSIQPLWIAGRCMSHISEHRIILALLRRIQRESGWAAQWRADDLVEVWGD